MKSRAVILTAIFGMLLAAHGVLNATEAYAEGSKSDFLNKRRGLITSASCPFSCRNLNLSGDLCRDWQSGDKCFVEDYTQVPGHRSMIRVPSSAFVIPSNTKQNLQNDSRNRQNKFRARGRLNSAAKSSSAKSTTSRRGMVTSSTCPYSCRHAGLSKRLCSEWTEGNKCFIEDMTQVPGHRSMIRIPQ